jgi:hypothetical protein
MSNNEICHLRYPKQRLHVHDTSISLSPSGNIKTLINPGQNLEMLLPEPEVDFSNRSSLAGRLDITGCETHVSI